MFLKLSLGWSLRYEKKTDVGKRWSRKELRNVDFLSRRAEEDVLFILTNLSYNEFYWNSVVKTILWICFRDQSSVQDIDAAGYNDRC